jgi:hypothetical protein
MAVYSAILSLAFLYTLADNCVERPDGLIIGGIFTILLMMARGISRSIRSVELRVPAGYFADVESWRMGPELRGEKVHLVPVPDSTPETRARKRVEIARHYNVRGSFLFVHVNLFDNRSEFQTRLEVSLRREGNDYFAEMYGAIAIANTIAFVSECIDSISIFIGLTRRDLMGQAVRYIMFGEGETGLMVYTILQPYWDATPDKDVRPLLFLMSLSPEATLFRAISSRCHRIMVSTGARIR